MLVGLWHRHRAIGALAGRVGFLGLVVAMAISHTATALEVEVQPATPVTMPSLGKIAERMTQQGFGRGAPIYIRIFKEESALEVWMQKDGRFSLFETYPICKYDGVLGPKLAEGDRQSPEGFYTVSPSQLRWTGRWYRGFDLSFPNAYDADQGRTGSAILIHGGCGSIGCYAMTNRVVDELFEIATEAFDGGQPRFSVHVFPFRMTTANAAKYNDDAWASFWKRLKPAYDFFEETRTPPTVSVCEAEYRIEAGTSSSDGSLAIERSCQPAGPVIASVIPELERDRHGAPKQDQDIRHGPAPLQARGGAQAAAAHRVCLGARLRKIGQAQRQGRHQGRACRALQYPARQLPEVGGAPPIGKTQAQCDRLGQKAQDRQRQALISRPAAVPLCHLAESRYGRVLIPDPPEALRCPIPLSKA